MTNKVSKKVQDRNAQILIGILEKYEINEFIDCA